MPKEPTVNALFGNMLHLKKCLVSSVEIVIFFSMGKGTTCKNKNKCEMPSPEKTFKFACTDKMYSAILTFSFFVNFMTS